MSNEILPDTRHPVNLSQARKLPERPVPTDRAFRADFNALPPEWRKALLQTCELLHKHGDGNIHDEWLRKDILSRKQWTLFVIHMKRVGWLRENNDKRVCRAGPLAPTPTTQPARDESDDFAEALHLSVTEDAPC